MYKHHPSTPFMYFKQGRETHTYLSTDFPQYIFISWFQKQKLCTSGDDIGWYSTTHCVAYLSVCFPSLPLFVFGIKLCYFTSSVVWLVYFHQYYIQHVSKNYSVDLICEESDTEFDHLSAHSNYIYSSCPVACYD